MTDTNIQVPGQLELPLEFGSPITKTITYFEEYTQVTKHTVKLMVPSRYQPLIDHIEGDQVTYQRTMEALVKTSLGDDEVTAIEIESHLIEDTEHQFDYRIK